MAIDPELLRVGGEVAVAGEGESAPTKPADPGENNTITKTSDNRTPTAVALPPKPPKTIADVEREVTPNLPWTGLLSDSQVTTLKQTYGSLIICPGVVSRFGKTSDDWGYLYIPGASSGFSQAKKLLASWTAKAATDPRQAWWIEELKDKGRRPITAGDILSKVRVREWKEYTDFYRRARARRSQKKSREKRLQFGHEMYLEEVREMEVKRLEAAAALAGLAGGGCELEVEGHAGGSQQQHVGDQDMASEEDIAGEDDRPMVDAAVAG